MRDVPLILRVPPAEKIEDLNSGIIGWRKGLLLKELKEQKDEGR